MGSGLSGELWELPDSSAAGWDPDGAARPWSAWVAEDVFPFLVLHPSRSFLYGNKLKEFCFPSSTGLLLGVLGGTFGAGNVG